MKSKFKKADFAIEFIDSVIKLFEHNGRNTDEKDDLIIPPYLFQEPKVGILVEILFCELNEKKEHLHLGKSLTILSIRIERL